MNKKYGYPMGEILHSPNDSSHSPVGDRKDSIHSEKLLDTETENNESITTRPSVDDSEVTTDNNTVEREKKPEAILLLSCLAKSGTNPAQWYEPDAPGFKSIKDYSTSNLRTMFNLCNEGKIGDFFWVECTENDFRVYSTLMGNPSWKEYKGLKRATGIFKTEVQGVIIPFGLIDPQTLEQLDLNPLPEFNKLKQLMEEQTELFKRRDELEKTIHEITAKWFGKFRSKKESAELESLETQIEKKLSDIEQAQDALAEAEKGRPLNLYESIITSNLLDAIKNPRSGTESMFLSRPFSALEWFKKIQALTEDKS